jgi:hypothetical protein
MTPYSHRRVLRRGGRSAPSGRQILPLAARSRSSIPSLCRKTDDEAGSYVNRRLPAVCTQAERGADDEDEAFPTLPHTESALRIRHVTTVSLPSPPHVRRSLTLAPILTLVALLSALGCVAIHAPVLHSEPLYCIINTAVTCSMTTLGMYMIIKGRERFTGICFAFAGFFYPIISLDIYPGWGVYLAFILGGGALFYTPLGWGVLRYGRKKLESGAERAFIPISIVLTSGTGFLATTFARPGWLGFSPGVKWFSVWPNETATEVAAIAICVGFNFIAVYFCFLVFRMLRNAPPTSRRYIRPIGFFGSSLAVGSAIIYTVTTLVPRAVPFHVLVGLVGLFTLGITAAFVLAIVREQLLGARLVERLPNVATPQSVAAYIKDFLEDGFAELLFWSPETDALIDENGLRRDATKELSPARFHTWISGNDGSRVALLACDPVVRRDPLLLTSLVRVVSLIADNARLNALLRMQVAQLTATRTAEQLASLRVREEFRRNLHDGVQQTIASVRLDVDRLHDFVSETSGREIANGVTEKLNLALGQRRRIAFDWSYRHYRWRSRHFDNSYLLYRKGGVNECPQTFWS